MLRNRTQVPKVVSLDNEERLLILPGEDKDTSTAQGRPIGEEYFNPSVKQTFMQTHSISLSVLSTANPWLDFLPASEASALATDLNQDLQELCEANSESSPFKGFGVLPSMDVNLCIAEIQRISHLSHLKGVILSSMGLGNGLGDKEMFPIWEALQQTNLIAFLHPHYGLGNEAYKGTGHSLSLALGFPFETSAALSQLILSGALDKFPHLKLLVAHAGGTLPFLAGRLDSCVKADAHISRNLEHVPSFYLKKMYFDAVCYHPAALKCLVELVGVDRIVFGTDHPFFPPEENSNEEGVIWPSAIANMDVIADSRLSPEDQDKILYLNAWKLLDLKNE